MINIGLDEVESTAFIVEVTRHLPPGDSLGKILAVTTSGILTDAAIFDFDAETDRASRLVSTPNGVNEQTFWRNGVEVARIVFRA